METNPLKSDACLLSYVVIVMLPDSSKGLYTSFEKIMSSNAIKNLGFTENEVKACIGFGKVEDNRYESHLFTKTYEDGMKAIICQNFFTTEYINNSE